MTRRGLLPSIFILLASQATAVAQTITLSSTAGPQTKEITVTGSGFSPSRLVEVYFDTSHMCLTASSNTGTARCTFAVPTYILPGTHWVTAAERVSGKAATASFSVRNDWVQYLGRTSAHNAYNRFETTLNTSNVANLEQRWRVRLSTPAQYESETGTPVIHAGRLFIGTNDGKLHALNTLTGAVLTDWPKQAGPAGRSGSANSPVIANGRVYIGGSDGKLYAFKINDGAVPAGFPFTAGTSAVRAAPTYAGGKILIRTGQMQAINVIGTPSFAWQTPSNGGLPTAATVVQGKVFYGAYSGGITSLDLSDGSSLPGFPMSGASVYSTPLAAFGAIYYLDATYGNLAAIRQSDGLPIPGFPAAIQPGRATPVAANGTVYAGDDSGRVYAFNASTGARRWTVQLDGDIYGLTIANQILFVATTNSLSALSAATGNTLAYLSGPFGYFTPAPFGPSASPVVSDGIVYLMSHDGYLHAFSLHGSNPAKAPARGQPGAASDEPPALSSLVPDPQIAMTPAIAD